VALTGFKENFKQKSLRLFMDKRKIRIFWHTNIHFEGHSGATTRKMEAVRTKEAILEHSEKG
jgi:hypothetical protein